MNAQVVPDLRHDIRQAEVNVKTLVSHLQEKGLLKKDPYHTEEGIDRLAVPMDDPLTGRERIFELTARLETYMGVLRYLSTEYPFTVSQMTNREIESIQKTISFIEWSHLSESSSRPTTAALSPVIFSAQKTANDVSGGVISDAISTVTKALQEASKKMEEIVYLHRQFVKATIRSRIIPEIADVSTVERFISAVREKWTAVLPEEPVSQQMLIEIWNENDPERGAGVQEALLATLRVEETEEASTERTRPAQEHLIDGVRAIATGSTALEKMVDKLSASAKLVGKPDRSFWALITQLFAKIFGKNEAKEEAFLVTILDSERGARRTEEILMSTFTENVKRKANVYTGILARSGNMWQRISRASEGEILEYLRGELDEISTIMQRSQGLDTYFRKHVVPAKRGQLRGINMEITLLQDQLARGSRKIADYETAIAEGTHGEAAPGATGE